MSNPRPLLEKAKVDDVVNMLALLSGGAVAAPFFQRDWPNAALQRPSTAARADIVSNLLPLYHPPTPPVGTVFEWIIRARRRGRR